MNLQKLAKTLKQHQGGQKPKQKANEQDTKARTKNK